MDSPQLIALYSPVMQSGKSTTGKVLEAFHGFKAVKFADPFKRQIEMLLREGGANDAMVERMMEGDLKEEPIPALGVSVRQMTQQLGSWGRSIHPDFWVNLAMPKVLRYLQQGRSVVIDDLRFPNEYEAVIRLGGAPVRVYRPGAEAYNAHPSEGLLEGYPMMGLENNGTLAQLRACAEELPRLLREHSI